MNHDNEQHKSMTQEELLLRKSLREINRLRAELKRSETSSSEPVAIVGDGVPHAWRSGEWWRGIGHCWKKVGMW